MDPFFADCDYLTSADARDYPAVTLFRTVNGVTTERTVPVAVVPDYVDCGGALFPGVVIQPEHVAYAFPDMSEHDADFMAECVAYSWNEGDSWTLSHTWHGYFRLDDGTDDPTSRLVAVFNLATRDAASIDRSEA